MVLKVCAKAYESRLTKGDSSLEREPSRVGDRDAWQCGDIAIYASSWCRSKLLELLAAQELKMTESEETCRILQQLRM